MTNQIRDLEEIFGQMEYKISYTVIPQGDGEVWEARAIRHGMVYSLGFGSNREIALANLLERMGVELTFDHPDNAYARWGKPLKAYGNKVGLEGIGWGYFSEIRGWRHG